LYATRKIFPSMLQCVEIALLCFAVNRFTGFLVGIAENKLRYMDWKRLVPSIARWFVNGIVLRIIGAREERARKYRREFPPAYSNSTTELSNQGTRNEVDKHWNDSVGQLDQIKIFQVQFPRAFSQVIGLKKTFFFLLLTHAILHIPRISQIKLKLKFYFHDHTLPRPCSAILITRPNNARPPSPWRSVLHCRPDAQRHHPRNLGVSPCPRYVYESEMRTVP
jgi:hypothetical protein